jgi:ribosomal protein S4
MKQEDVDRGKEKKDKHGIEKKKKEEWHKQEKMKMIEQRKEYMNYIKGVMHRKGFNPKLKKDKFLGGVRGRG